MTEYDGWSAQECGGSAPMSSSGTCQFSLRAILLWTAFIAVLIASSMQVRYYYFLLRSHANVRLTTESSIKNAVSALNRQVALHIMSSDLKLQEWELRDAVIGQKIVALEPYGNEATRLRVQAQVDAVCDQLAKSGVLPAGSELDMSRRGIVTMRVPFDAGSGYRFIIRHPGLKRQPSGQYQMNFTWRPKAGNEYIWTGRAWQDRPKD
ncbi:MAG: hypothetical protein ACTHK7_19970 [Aureliella sp.]